MKKTLALLLLATLPLFTNGCVTGRGWQGLIPDKDVEIANGILTLMTPYGQQTLRFDRFATRVDPAGTNAVGPQGLPKLVKE